MAEKLWTVKEVAEYLDMNSGSIYHLVSQKRIPRIHISSRCLRFDPPAIKAWVAERMENAQSSDSANRGTVVATKRKED